MLFFSGGIRAAMWIAVIPAVFRVLVVFLLREPEQKQAATRNHPIGKGKATNGTLLAHRSGRSHLYCGAFQRLFPCPARS